MLELQDTKGKVAVFKRRQKVKFLQDNIIAYQDYAWGDGNILADYKCSPGVPLDQYQDGFRYNILISLRETKNRGDVVDFREDGHRRIYQAQRVATGDGRAQNGVKGRGGFGLADQWIKGKTALGLGRLFGQKHWLPATRLPDHYRDRTLTG